MYFTPYAKQDGYWESICYLKEGLGPILKCRAVLKANGNYDSIVRDYTTGKMVASIIEIIFPQLAKDTAKTLAMIFVNGEVSGNIKGDR